MDKVYVMKFPNSDDIVPYFASNESQLKYLIFEALEGYVIDENSFSFKYNESRGFGEATFRLLADPNYDYRDVSNAFYTVPFEILTSIDTI